MLAVPTTAAALAPLIERMPSATQGEPQFDLWDRLVAQEGYERARDLWNEACRHLYATS